MINIIFDSSIFFQDRKFISSGFKQIKVLGKKGLISIHIPKYVQEECISKNEIEIAQELDSIVNNLNKIHLKGLDDEEILMVDSIVSELAELESAIQKSVKSNWEKFVNESNAKVHGLNEISIEKITIDYFNGNPPFKNRKSRKDFPDAFIFQSIRAIISTYENCVFISKDVAFRETVKSTFSIECFESLRSFIASGMYKPIKEIYEKELKLESEKESLANLKQLILEETNKYILNQFNYFQIEDELLLSDDKIGTIQGVSEIISNDFSVADVIFIEDIAYLNCDMFAKVLVDFYLNKNEYLMLDTSRQNEISISDWNKYVFWAEEKFDVELILEVSIKRKNLNVSDFIIEHIGVKEAILI